MLHSTDITGRCIVPIIIWKCRVRERSRAHLSQDPWSCSTFLESRRTGLLTAIRVFLFTRGVEIHEFSMNLAPEQLWSTFAEISTDKSSSCIPNQRTQESGHIVRLKSRGKCSDGPHDLGMSKTDVLWPLVTRRVLWRPPGDRSYAIPEKYYMTRDPVGSIGLLGPSSFPNSYIMVGS